MGAALSSSIIHWGKVGEVISGIFLSILLSGIAGFLIQRAFRGAIGGNAQDPRRVRLHGPWIAGLMMTWLTWFMLLKGLKAVPAVGTVKDYTIGTYGAFPFLIGLWMFYFFVFIVILMSTKDRGSRYLFHGMSILGMLCMAFAFGQNDLANCASPGLSTIWLWRHADEAVSVASKIPIPHWTLFSCGILIVLGMRTRNAQRVTRAEVNTGSQFDHVALWAPNWCRALARLFLKEAPTGPALVPPPSTTETGKHIHYDTLRASVVMAVSASVIAFASGRGLPVSTTYVAFAAVVATGWGDRVFHRGDADLKVGRAIWVVIGWFLAALIAVVAGIVVAMVILKLGLLGVGIALAANLIVRTYFKKRADTHELRYHVSQEHSGDTLPEVAVQGETD